MKAKLTRIESTEEGVRGILTVNDLYVAVTLEQPWKANKRRVSCIPEGIYEVAITRSPSKGRVYKLKDVPGRSDILIHKGNSAKDTQGCILLGTTLSFGKSYITGSSVAFDKFMDLMLGKEFILEVVS